MHVPPRPDPCLVSLRPASEISKPISDDDWRRARRCEHGCGTHCRNLRHAAPEPEESTEVKVQKLSRAESEQEQLWRTGRRPVKLPPVDRRIGWPA